MVEELYGAATLATFELTIPEACRDALDAAPTEYCEGSVTYLPPGGESLSFPSVGIRLKGRATFQPLSEKPSFKVKLDEYVAGERLFGVRRLTLNNMVQDPSMAHEVLGYRYLRATGVPAPLCNYARVVVDGEPYGLYANLETADDEFAERRFDPAPGNLFDTTNDQYFVDLTPSWLGSFELETNRDQPDTSDLETLIDAVGAPDESFYAEVGEHLDWDEVLTLGAAQAIIADWDGYFGAANNYKLYHELARDRFLLIPWGIDQTFGTGSAGRGDPLEQLDYALDHSRSNRDNGVLFRRCWEDEQCRADYLARVETVLGVWNSHPLVDELDAALALTEEARAEDARRPYDDERSASYVDGLRTFLTERGQIVEAALAELRAER
ncbi:MAG: CotH kinase family protein [Polyangiaceae bacterium]|nr:CotH kinase family protein [Polyangiaceae bacterium]